MSVTQKYNSIILIFFMGGPEGLNLGSHFEAEVDWTGVPIDSTYQRIQDEYAHPARQDPFSGFAYYEARERPRKKKPKRKAIMPPQGDDYNFMGLGKAAIKGMRTFNTLKAFAKNFNVTEGQMTKDMIIGPHRKRKLGTDKYVNVRKQLKQLVDDTKVLKTQFKLKITSADGLRQWAQMVCRYRAAPGTLVNGLLSCHGTLLEPDVMFEAKATNADYYHTMPPLPRGDLAVDTYNIEKTTEDTGTSNLFYLNLPLTYLEQDMFNMGMGPGKRNVTYDVPFGEKGDAILNSTNQATGNATTNDTLTDAGAIYGPSYDDTEHWLWNGPARDRFTRMMKAIHPKEQNTTFESVGSFKATGGHVADKFNYNFRRGWGINMLDYSTTASHSDVTGSDPGYGADIVSNADLPGRLEPQYIKTNNSVNTVATIKTGSISFSMNNMGESQAYITVLVVTQKHVDKHYWSMPESLCDSYMKAAQAYLYSGEWSISNNISTAGAANSEGENMNAYMYVTHPTIKPFGKVPTRFLKDFEEHFTIKLQTTIKLGLGERQSMTIDLGGLQYSAEQIAMETQTQYGGPGVEYPAVLPTVYKPVNGDDGNPLEKQHKVFPMCCQQGTTHVLFGVQGMSLPYISDTTNVTSVQGRWAVPACIDIQGTYKEVIAPLSTKPKKETAIQKMLTRLPDPNYTPIVTALPRVRTTTVNPLTAAITPYIPINT